MPKQPVPICGDTESEGSSAFCMPATVTAFQVANMRSCNLCAYHKLDGKLVKLSETVSKVAYLYVSPGDTKKLSRKDKHRLYADGVRDLHIHKQYEGRLKCEYVGTKSISVPRRTCETSSTNWVWWILAVCIVIIFGCVVYYLRKNTSKTSKYTDSEHLEDPIAW